MAVAEQIQVRDTLYIGGEWVAPAQGRQIEVRNPATEQVIGRIPAGTHDDVESAAVAAAGAFEEWSATPRARRAELLGAVGAGLRQRGDELAALMATSSACR